jgi:hypothetical protein
VKAVLDAAGKPARVPTDDARVIEAFQDLFEKTFKPIKTRDRKDGPMPKSLQVVKVTKVYNEVIWNEYIVRREQVLWQNGKVGKTKRRGGINLPAGVKPTITQDWFDTPRVKAIEGLDPNFRKDVNETFMFHGTNAKAAQAITETDFLLSMSGSATGSMLGRGIYLAECSSKSDEYTKEEASTRVILVCRTCLGRMFYTDERTPDAGAIEQLCGVGKAKGMGDYDSVCGDREKINRTYREFCVFDDDLVYPEYIVHYKRVM